MILVDFSIIQMQMIHGSINIVKPHKENGTYVTKEFIHVTKSLILHSLFDLYTKFSREYGEMTVCLDNSSSWRKNVYAPYKSTRKSNRETSEINFKEVFSELSDLVDALRKYTPFRVLDTHNAEGDDIILVLAKNTQEKTIIISSDKDMIQAQKNPLISQYSPITKKFITAETKAELEAEDSMEEWLIEHVVLGDHSDEIPKITDGTKFSDEFMSHIKSNGLDDLSIEDFEEDNLKRNFSLENFNVYTKNRKGENDKLKIFDDPKVGPSTVRKLIKTHGSLENWINTDDILKKHFERNKMLILQEYIPEKIQEAILENYSKTSVEYRQKEFLEYCKNNNLGDVITELPINFKSELTMADFLDDW